MTIQTPQTTTATSIETPCVKICVIDSATKRCTGCWRSLEEIARWSSFTASERRRIMTELPGRAAKSNGA
ncbi:MAG: DUF1289 domain-containing protein [Hyphomicrobium sp.]